MVEFFEFLSLVYTPLCKPILGTSETLVYWALGLVNHGLVGLQTSNIAPQ
jgi:hypothetical protein